MCSNYWLHKWNEPSLDNNENIVDFTGANCRSKSFKYKQKITCQTHANGRKNAKIMVQLKYWRNFWRTLELLLINCEINLIRTWSEECVIASSTAANQATHLAITDKKLYVPVVTLSTQDNAKLLKQLKSGFKKTNNWNKYQSEVTIQAPISFYHLRILQIEQYIQNKNSRLIDFSFLSFENTTDRAVHTK